MDGLASSLEVIACVDEFYTTTDSERRHNLDRVLCCFKTAFPCEKTISICIMMMEITNPAHVQYFGAVSLYDTVRERSDECISNPLLMDSLKTFLIENLTVSSRILMQSVTNKLSSTLALLALYCMPDVWAQPVQDLTNKWATTPELLLRVLAEVAAEFANIKMPLTQRSILKTELHRISEEIILIITTVMGAQDASPSSRQAAVECVEQWVQVPGVGLQQWTNVLSIVFAAVSEDNAALTNLLNILAVNDELDTLEQLVLDICSYITQVASHKIASELREEGDSDEAVSLVSAVCTLAERAVPTLIRYARLNKSNTLVEVCQLFATLSSWEGVYPMDESISDLPAVFWTTLREHLMGEKSQNVILSVRDCYANVLATAVTKLAYPPENVYNSMDHEKKEKFVTYRMARSEISLDAYYIAGGNETLNFLNQKLEEYINSDLCKAESVIFLWQLVADYLTEENYEPICKCLELCSQYNEIPGKKDSDRVLCSMMKLLHDLSHLIQDHPNAITLETHALRLIVSAMNQKSVIESALVALEKYAENRSECLMVVGEHISERCYNCFMDEHSSVAIRMAALKCIGYFLSLKSSDTIMDIVNRMIAPHVASLVNAPCISHQDQEAERLFQIQIFSCLFSTLRQKTDDTDGSVIVSILEQAIPVFKQLLTSQGSYKTVGDKVCEAIRSAIGNLSPGDLIKIFPFVAETIESSLFSNSTASCALARSCVLMYCNIKEIVPDLCKAIAKWFSIFETGHPHTDLEPWLLLEYQVVKKNWKTLRSCPEQALEAISHAITLCGNLLLTSQEPSCVKLCAQVLATITSQTASFGDEEPKLLLARNGPQLVKAIFARVQTEIARNTIEFLAESLQFFAKFFRQETRAVINQEGFEDSPLVAGMFRESGNLKNFKQMTIRFNLACRNVISVPS
ncbi:unnamed protein product [Auanema sp. JU1783]|nr:unnamed protein product [Auanema sp. JU1783]